MAIEKTDKTANLQQFVFEFFEYIILNIYFDIV